MKALLRLLLITALLGFSHLSFSAELVNINTADAPTLAATMTGVGEKRAEAIVAYREQHGPFESVEDLVRVSGIGSKVLEDNREKLHTGKE
jgi:competence protein ComEA